MALAAVASGAAPGNIPLPRARPASAPEPAPVSEPPPAYDLSVFH